MSATLEKALSKIPAGLLAPLLKEYEAALSAASTSRWEEVGLKAGKICEIIYSILKGYTDGSFPNGPSKPKNMLEGCRAFEAADQKKFCRSVRIQIPRLITAIYELRNNRDIGHVGGDVRPNEMDGRFFLQAIKWLMAELVRVFHATTTDAARALIDSVSLTSFSPIWSMGSGVKILRPSSSMKEKTLMTLYHEKKAIKRAELFKSVGHSNRSVFLKTVIAPLNKKALVHFDKEADTVILSPLGQKYIEESGLLNPI